MAIIEREAGEPRLVRRFQHDGADVLSRRNLIRGIVGGAGVALLGRSAAAQDNAPGTTEGDCSKLEGLQLLIDWLAQKEVIPPDQLRPKQNWKIFRASGTGVSFFYPGDWTANAMWANTLTRAGAIDWKTKQEADDYLWGVRLVSPDEQAIYEYVSGTLTGVALDLNSAAVAAEQGVLGDGKTTKPICVYEDTVSFTHNWTRASSYQDQSVVTGGNLYTTNDAYLSASIISYQTFIGPEKDFTNLMRTIYIPIMFQFMTGAPRTSWGES